MQSVIEAITPALVLQADAACVLLIEPGNTTPATISLDDFIAVVEKQRDAIEKIKDLDAQYATVAALNANIVVQKKKISQLQSTYQSELQKELADIRARIAQLQPNLDKTIYKEGLMELRAPQDGTIKDLDTTTRRCGGTDRADQASDVPVPANTACWPAK